MIPGYEEAVGAIFKAFLTTYGKDYVIVIHITNLNIIPKKELFV
jgi:hypothetical protein